jgi:hypothetical protein
MTPLQAAVGVRQVGKERVGVVASYMLRELC